MNKLYCAPGARSIADAASFYAEFWVEFWGAARMGLTLPPNCPAVLKKEGLDA